MADKILVLHAGQVVEHGTHRELLLLQGRYANTWQKQNEAQDTAEEQKDDGKTETSQEA